MAAVMLQWALDKHYIVRIGSQLGVHHLADYLVEILIMRAHDALWNARAAAGELDAGHGVPVPEQNRLFLRAFRLQTLK